MNGSLIDLEQYCAMLYMKENILLFELYDLTTNARELSPCFKFCCKWIMKLTPW